MTFTVSDRLLTWWQYSRNALILVIVSAFVVHSGITQGATSGRALATYAGLAAGATGWVLTTVRRGGTAAVVLCGVSGLWLTAVLPGGSGPAFLVAAASVASASMPFARAAALCGSGAVLLSLMLGLRGQSWATAAEWLGATALILLLGVIRRQREERVEQQILLAEERALAETLAERAYLAREIHDVLAHSLSALSVQLETAAALLERDRAAEAAVIVDKAGQLARDGLTEARRAVGTLRGDPIPLGELIGELAAGYRADFDVAAEVTVSGAVRGLAPEAGLVLYRAAQESLANIRKHAPGSPVAICLTYESEAVALSVVNGRSTRPPITGLSSGYGLTGMRERAELAGGTATAGPSSRTAGADPFEADGNMGGAGASDLSGPGDLPLSLTPPCLAGAPDLVGLFGRSGSGGGGGWQVDVRIPA